MSPVSNRSPAVPAEVNAKISRSLLRAALVCAAAIILAACSSGAGNVQEASGQGADPATVDFPIFYVKRYADPTQAHAPGIDLRILCFAIPSAALFLCSCCAP